MLTSDCSGGVIVSSPGDIVLVQQTLTGDLAMRSQEVKPMTVLNEVRILKSVCHPCIINLKDVIYILEEAPVKLNQFNSYRCTEDQP